MHRSTVFYLAVVMVFGLEFGQTFSNVIGDLLGKLGLVLIFGLAAAALSGLRPVPTRLLVVVALFAAGLAFGLRPNPYAIGQVVLDLKLPLAAVGGARFVTQRLLVRRYPAMFLGVLGLSLALALVQFASPAIYHRLFPHALISTVISGTSIRRATGAFFHPGIFSVFTCLALMFFVILGIYRGFSQRTKLGIALAVLCLVASGQRLEALSALTMLVLVYVINYARHPLRMAALLLAGFVALVAAGSGITAALETAEQNFSGSVDTDEMIPRVLLWTGAVKLANAEFPRGAGLGTYGSSMSLNNPKPAYVRSGVTSAWWYGKKSFLMDSYWAKALGELGWIGAALLLASLVTMLLGPAADSKRRDAPELAFAARLAFCALGFGLLDSVAAPIYTGSALPILLMGGFYGYYLKVKGAAPARPARLAGAPVRA